MALSDTLEREVGPLPIGGWILLVGGGATAAWIITRSRSRTETRTIVDQIPVPVGSVASVDRAPLVTSPIVNVNVPALEALTDAVTGQTEATLSNTTATASNTEAITGNTTATTTLTQTISKPLKVENVTVSVPPSGPSVPYPGRIHLQGNRGGIVTIIQQQLNKRGASPRLAEDGIFGPATRAAVVAFQRRNGLLVDGVVGPQTWGALF